MDDANHTKQDNYLVRLFKGDVPLVITYWVFGFLIGGLFARGILAVLEANFASLAMKEGGAPLIQSFYWLVIGYSAFILIAIWRSAGKFQGNSAWAILARAIVIINAISFAASFLLTSDSDYTLNEEINMMNKSLPVMVDDDTRLETVTVHEGDVYFNYTLVNWLVADIDVESASTMMQPELKTIACESSDTKPLLEEGRSISYVYRDKENNPVLKVIVTMKDCI